MTAVPLAPSQDGLWLLQQLAPDSAAYHNVLALRLRGRLDADLLRRCLNELVDRHDALRLTFHLAAGGPAQEVLPRFTPPFDVVRAGQDPVMEVVTRESRRPFELAAAPPVRAVLIQVAPEDQVLLLVLHHLVSDGTSIMLLLGELTALYSAYARGEPSPLAPAASYLDFARWQREQLTARTTAAHVEYWRRQLAGAPPVLELPLDHPRPRARTFEGATFRFDLDDAVAARVPGLAREHGATPYMVLTAALQLMLARSGGQDDVTVGAPVTYRLRPRFRGVVGYLVNTVAMRTSLAGDPTFGELLERVRATAIGAYAHATLPFERVVEAVAPPRLPGVQPLYQVLLSFFDEGSGGALDPTRLDATSHRMGDLAVEILPYDLGGARADLTVCAHDTARGLGFDFEYSTELFDASTVERMAGRMETLLAEAVQDPGRRVWRMDALTASERRLLAAWNGTGAEYPHELCLHELFERQAARTPGAVAVRFGHERVTYGELEAYSNRLAHRLRELGARPEAVVAIMADRSLDAVVAMLAVLKAGAAYVAVDHCQPWTRTAGALRELGVRLLVAEDRLAGSVPAGDLRVLRPAAEREMIASLPPSRPPRRAVPGNLAFVIATSGTTGTPKGVGIEHGGAVSLLSWASRTYGREELAGVLAATSACFDCTLFELFAPLSWGGTAVLAPSALELADQPAAGEVRVLSTVPSVMAELLERGALPASVRTVNLAGEALPPALADRLHAETRVERVLNLYGPSEATTYATMLTVPPGCARMTVGRPIDNVRAHVLDGELQPVPIGVRGELCLAGVGLARGYLGRPAETAERFVPDPFGPAGGRLYRTGDRARWLAAGEIEFLGRLDQQVKVRGVRVEPAEVELAVAAHPDVAEAAVLAERREDGDPRLLVYVRPRRGREVTAGELRAFLLDRLPAAMLPDAVVSLDAFPLTANGKVDRRALPRPEPPAPGAGAAPPATPTEAVLASIWTAVLGAGGVGRDDDFFDLGGHSLAAMQVVARVRETLDVDLPLEAVFEAGTLAALAARVESAERSHDAGPPLVPASRDQPLPLSFGQQRLWFLHQVTPDDPAYNMPLQLRLHGRLDVGALERTLEELVRRHEALRITFVEEGGEVWQVVRPELRLPLAPRRLVGTAEEREAEALRLAEADAARPFDLASGPLIRASLLQVWPDDHVLSIVTHHAVCDGLSLQIFLRELSGLYEAYRRGQPSPLAELRLQYADFASWQRRRLDGPTFERQVAYWTRELRGAPPALEMPTDHPRRAQPSSRSGTARFKVGASTTEALRRLSREAGATLFATLLAAYQVLLARYSGQADVLVGTPVAGRGHAELDGMVGFFVNTLVLRGDLTGSPSFRELLARTRRTVVGALANQDLPFERLVDHLDVPRDLRLTPLFQTMFHLDTAVPPLRLEGLRVSGLAGEGAAAKVDLTVTFTDAGEFLAGRLDYRLDLFEAATARRMVRHLVHLLEAVAADPDRGILELPLLGARERERIAARGAGPAAVEPESLVRAFERNARRRPEAVAVAGAGRQLTYGELDRASGRLARRLRCLGVGTDVPVGVLAHRRPELLVGVLAVARAGGAFVPLDPALPAERLAYMVRDSGARVLIAGADLPPQLAGLALPAVSLDEAGDAGPLEASASGAPGDALAYVVYTSGSTGTPKGVGVTVRNLACYLAWAVRDYPVGPGEGALLHSTIGADLSITALLAPLAGGGLVELLDEAPGVESLAAALRRGARRRLVKMTPTHLDLLPADVATVPGPAAWVTGGEPLMWEAVDRWARLWPDTVALNEYGPTETTVACTLYRPAAGAGHGQVPIGVATDGTFLAVLDERMEPVPDGVTGMLYIGGLQVARAYVGRPAQTADAFVPDPFGEPGGRLYRSGDLARWRSDGQLECLGRADRQVKVMGNRVEPGEVETVIRAHPGVREAAVEVRDGLLAAYVVTDGGEPSALRAHLAERLPTHMVPTSITRLDALPLTASGKLDRAALPAPGAMAAGTREARELRSGEQGLAAIWAEVLGTDGIRPSDSFFDLGGTSYQALHVLRRIEDATRLVLPLADFLRHPTLEGLAGLVASRRPSHPWSPLVLTQAGDRGPALFAAPPLGGQGSYLELARALGRGRAVYGLECRGLYRGRPWGTVPAMARGFATAVRSVQPHGPYLLCGYSFGAVLALETARRLAAAGERVGLLALIDPPPARTARPAAAFDEAGFWAYLVRERLELPDGSFEELVASLRGMSGEEQIEWTVATLEAAGRMPQDWRPLSARQLRRAMRVECTNAAAEWRHVVRPYEGDAVAIEAGLDSTADRREEVRSWRSVVRGELRIHQVSADHDTIVWERAPAAEVASILDGYLNAV